MARDSKRPPRRHREPAPDADWFQPADPEHVRREKGKARELRKSQWWKNRLATGVCYYCKRRFHPSELTMDHIVPIIRGGRSTRRNVAPCCKECNAAKNYRLPVEWRTDAASSTDGKNTEDLPEDPHREPDVDPGKK